MWCENRRLCIFDQYGTVGELLFIKKQRKGQSNIRLHAGSTPICAYIADILQQEGIILA